MPLRRAHYVIAAMLLATLVAFWPGYFSVLRSARAKLHFHAGTATAWMLLLAIQSWTIHSRWRNAHRIIGMGSLFLFPLFLAGSTAVVLSMARSTPSDPFYQINGAPLGIPDVASPFILVALFYCALKHRRSVQLHARYMLATSLPLVEPIAERILEHHIPPFTSFDMDQFIWILRAAEVEGLVAALWLHALSSKYGRPFLIVAIAMISQAVLVETVGMTRAWHALFVELETLSTRPVLAAATGVGALTGWMGWTAGVAPRKLKAVTT